MKALLVLLNVGCWSMLIWVGSFFVDALQRGNDRDAGFYGVTETMLLVLTAIVIVLTEDAWRHAK